MDSESFQRFDRPATPSAIPQEALISALLDAIDEPVGGDAGHVRRVRDGALILAGHLRRVGDYRGQIDDEFVQQLSWATPLHDIGKVAVDRNLLAKPDGLSADELTEVRRHVLIGGQILDRAGQLAGGSPSLAMAADIARFHHERFDGSGYCEGLKGNDIPLAARIVALADVFDALTSRRVYKPKYAPEKARDMIEAESGRHFDPLVVVAFCARFDDFVALARREAAGMVRQPAFRQARQPQ